MSFERTALGQANRHIFMRADAVVYVEGGDQESGAEHSPDISYWRSLFRHYKPEKNYRFLAKGSKENLVPLAKEILDNDIPNVFVAMDSDYDDFRLLKIDDSRVLYTYGYSWENDVFVSQNIFETFISIFHMCSSHQQAWADIQKIVRVFQREIFWIAVADYLAIKIGRSVIPRSKPGKILIDGGRINPPAVDRKKAKQMITVARSEIRDKTVGGILGFEVPRYCVGHLFEAFVTRMFKWLSYRFAKGRNVSNDQVTAMAIQLFSGFLVHNPEAEISSFYRNQFAKF